MSVHVSQNKYKTSQSHVIIIQSDTLKIYFGLQNTLTVLPKYRFRYILKLYLSSLCTSLMMKVTASVSTTFLWKVKVSRLHYLGEISVKDSFWPLQYKYFFRKAFVSNLKC